MAGTVIDGNTLAEELSEHVHEELRQLRVSGAPAWPRSSWATIMPPLRTSATCGGSRSAWSASTRTSISRTTPSSPMSWPWSASSTPTPHHRDPRARPLPAGISEPLVYRALDPYKDVEAVHPENAGLLAQGRPRFVPSTPASCFYLLDAYARSTGREPESFYPGSTLVVVGRSDS